MTPRESQVSSPAQMGSFLGLLDVMRPPPFPFDAVTFCDVPERSALQSVCMSGSSSPMKPLCRVRISSASMSDEGTSVKKAETMWSGLHTLFLVICWRTQDLHILQNKRSKLAHFLIHKPRWPWAHRNPRWPGPQTRVASPEAV